MATVAQYEQAERRYLATEGVDAETLWVDLPRTGSQLRVLAAGEGPPVLFVPGTMTSGAVFAGLVGRLPKFRCVMIDRPGVALSPVPNEPPTTLRDQERLADALLVDVLDGLGIETASVVSTSLGGWTTFRSASAHPDRFRRIAALAFQVGARLDGGPVTMRAPAPPAWMLPRRVRAPRGVVRSVLKSAGMRGAFESGKFSDEMLDWVVALFRRTETFRNESLYSPRPFNLRGPLDSVRHTPELLDRVSAPVHLVWGSDDVFGGESSAQEFASLLPHATLHMVAGAGHAPWLDEPELVAEAVRTHLAS